MAVLLDTSPLRASPAFRRLWLGQAVSFLGSALSTAALPFQLYRETGSSLAVGLLGAAQLVPLLVGSLVGGALADAVDKRRLLLAEGVVALLCSAALAANAALDDPQLWLLYVLGALGSATFAVGYPVTRSLLPMLVEPDRRPAAYALHAAYGSFGMMAGPAAGGVLIGLAGPVAAYLVDAATFAVALACFVRLPPAPPVPGAGRASGASIAEGLRFLRGRPVITTVFGLDLLAMVFGMPRALFPALAERLGGGPALYGLLHASVAAGAFAASVTGGWTSGVRRQGAAVLWAVAAWGVAVAAVGLVRHPAPALALLAAAGAADMVSGVHRSAIAADVTPDELRGRVSGVELAVYAGGPVLGDVEAGVAAGLLGVPFAITSGGVACVAGAAAVARLVPSFARHRRPDPVAAAPPAPAAGAAP